MAGIHENNHLPPLREVDPGEYGAAYQELDWLMANNGLPRWSPSVDTSLQAWLVALKLLTDIRDALQTQVARHG